MRLADPEPTPAPRRPLDEGRLHFDAAEPDHAQAVHWFELAAEAGDAEGLAMLALCQLEGLGLPRDTVHARERLEQAAARGSATGQYHLGRALVAGWGGPPDAARAVALYVAAAAQGHADACFNLGACLDAGWGCQPDRLAAKALFLRARALGSPLKAPGVRVRQRELDALRELARRLDSGELADVIDKRQHEIALMQTLKRQRRRTPRPRVPHRTGTGTGAGSVAGALAAAVLGLFGWRAGAPLAHDSGPTSIA